MIRRHSFFKANWMWLDGYGDVGLGIDFVRARMKELSCQWSEVNLDKVGWTTELIILIKES